MILSDQEEKLLQQLQQIVPTLPKNRKVSKLEVIENVIEYIMNLERVLEDEPADSVVAHNTSTLLQECSNILQNSNLHSKTI